MTSHPLARGIAPVWASGWGEDRYGVWAEFVVGRVQHRMRWVPAGSFVMGSPASEPVRFANEVQHEVEVDGCWLGAVPVTQDLWMAVLGEGNNPSGFEDPQRPVEQVSWDECQAMLVRLNERVPGLNASLPWEAEWE